MSEILIDKDLSMIEFLQKFNDKEICEKYLVNLRWSDGVICPFCGADKSYVTNRGYCCSSKYCKKKFTVKVKTLFENSKFPLSTWFYLIYSSVLNKKNISSVQIAKNSGLTQMSAWYALNTIRNVFAEKENKKLSGTVEVDEAFVCADSNFSITWGRFKTRKRPILGLVERGGRVKIIVIKNRKKVFLEDIIRENVELGSTIYTDGFMSYRNLAKDYNHQWLDHQMREWVRGEAHTNTIEGVWSILKTSIRNHHSVSYKHIQKYCDEIAYRYNYRHLTATERFDDVLKRFCGIYESNQKEKCELT